MCQYFKPKFPYRIKMIPMGSYPRIMDVNGSVYDLFGPVNLFWSTRYDKAMTLYLTLCNLKWALYWFIGNTNFQSLNAMAPPRVAVPAAASMYIKRSADSKSDPRNSAHFKSMNPF